MDNIDEGLWRESTNMRNGFALGGFASVGQSCRTKDEGDDTISHHGEWVALGLEVDKFDGLE